MVGVVGSAGALVGTEGVLEITYGLGFSLCAAPLNTPALDLHEGVGRRGRGPASGGRSNFEYGGRVKGDGQVPSRAGEESKSEQTKSDEE